MFVQTQSWSFLLFKMNAGIVEYLEVFRGIKVELEFAEEAEAYLSSSSQPGPGYCRKDSLDS